MDDEADRTAKPVRLTPAEAGRRARSSALAEADIRAILAAAGDDPVFARLDQAKVCALLVKARFKAEVFDGVVPDFGLKTERVRDPASLARANARAKHYRAIDKLCFGKMQERTFRKWCVLDVMERLMTEVDATATLYDNCPNRALMGKLMAYVAGEAVGSIALKGWMVRKRRSFRE
jgi:hypothetical protein